MTSEASGIEGVLPRGVRRALSEVMGEFATGLGVRTRLQVITEAGPLRLYPSAENGSDPQASSEDPPTCHTRLAPRDGPEFLLDVWGDDEGDACRILTVLSGVAERIFDLSQEIHYFTEELRGRYEEINLLYSISDTLGTTLAMSEAAKDILADVCENLGARRGSLWQFDEENNLLELKAWVGEEGRDGPIRVDDPDSVTARVFREGQARMAAGQDPPDGYAVADTGEDNLSVPIHYSPQGGESRTVGVINVLGRSRGGPFTAGDKRLLAAIASQVGAALENNRLVRESLRREGMAREMELAHNLQMKLLRSVDDFDPERVAARVEPHEQVGGDFYQLIRLPEGRIGVMIGDVSTHGFPAALIMALSMSAVSIYAAEHGTPTKVLHHVDDALRDELEMTEMFLSLFYGVLDPVGRRLVYSNAGHPHAFMVRGDGALERLDATDPPVGLAGPDAYGQSEVPWTPEADLLFLFTDGLSDSLTSEATGNGEDFVLRQVAENRHRSPREIIQILFELSKKVTASIPSDDRTAILLRG
jgi:sigma-B regulation protein RsbU (phosphoserine phosphatase)